MASRRYRCSGAGHFFPLVVGQVEVQKHDDAGLRIETGGQRDDPNPNGDAEVIAGEVEEPEGAD